MHVSPFTPVTWEPSAYSLAALPHGVSASRSLWATEQRYLFEWCREHVGQQAPLWAIHPGAAWAHDPGNDVFSFRHQGDMTMFVLAHAGLNQHNF